LKDHRDLRGYKEKKVLWVHREMLAQLVLKELQVLRDQKATKVFLEQTVQFLALLVLRAMSELLDRKGLKVSKAIRDPQALKDLKDPLAIQELKVCRVFKDLKVIPVLPELKDLLGQ
jgi:hypothetical protein